MNFLLTIGIKSLPKCKFLSLLLILICSISLNTYGQQAPDKKITLNTKNDQITVVFDKISQITGFTFFYDENVIENIPPVNAGFSNVNLEEVLKKLSVQTGLDFVLKEKTITVSRKKEVASKAKEASQSKRTVTGVISDAKSEPIIGASVLVKGEKTGTITDIDGKFAIEVQTDASLVISYIGFLSQDIKIGDKKHIDIRLSEDTRLLDEVVIVGYTPMRKSDFTGALANVKASELPLSSPTLGQALAGKIAGVQVSQASGAPGDGVKIRVRGTNSLSASSTPLYVIDGYPATEDVNINPNDVETIDVLKDAASAAIYGSRGASGVVLITTKRGKSGKALIEYDYQFSVQQVSKKIDLLNADQYRDLVIEARNNSYRDLAEAAGKSWNPLDDNATRASKGFAINQVGIPEMFFDFTTGKPVTSKYNTDWQEAIFSNAPMHRHNIGISGGQQNLKYRFSLGHLDQDGIIAPSNHRRVNVRANVDADVTSKLHIGVNFSFDDINNREVQASGRYINDGVVQSALLMFPQFPVYNDDGSYAVGNQIAMKSLGFQMVENPVALAHEIDIRSKSNRMNFNTNISYDILKNLKANANLGTQYFHSRYNYYRPRTVGQDGDMPNSESIVARVKAQDQSVRDIDQLGEFTLNYNGTLGKHKFQALLGASAQKKTYDRVYITGIGFPDDRIHEITAHGPNPGDITLDNATRKAAWTMLSYFSRLNYSFDDRYVVTGTVRTDGSSRFGAQNRWGWFPSVSGGWTLSNEKFFKEKYGKSTSIRLRASWGLSGNNNIGNYEHTSSMSSGGYPFGNSVESAYWEGGFRDEAIGWEKTAQYNLGFDIGLIGGRINLIGNYFNSESYDLLYDQPISSISGSKSVKTNLTDARVRNRGFDFQVDGRILTGAFSWNMSANLTVNRNKVLNMGGINDLYLVGERSVVSHVTRAGSPIGSFFGYFADGIISESDYRNILIDKSNLVNGKLPEGYTRVGPAVPNYSSVRAGDVLWRDVDGNGTINDEDRGILGDAFPDFTYGISTNFAYKGFDLSAVFTGSQGAKVINFQKYYLYNMEGSGNQLSSVLNRWQSDANPGNGEVFRAARHSTTNVSMRLASYMVEDASYFRCANITLGYTFNNALLRKIRLQGLRLYGSVDNLFTISDYQGYNPEVDYKGDNLLPGFDWGVYPLARTFSVGAKLTF
ncbi:TonB-dependent receptor [Dysgonomonas sp. ZJ709]|uniref:TonB-dependent receptor n=1 Tax=Dysgonomonas sp. ZJ709 TaxID=2709797 RepID=UPI0013EBDB24|nr:TonB-dependent receptor [Dysgonomonas sp. ZJ709]